MEKLLITCFPIESNFGGGEKMDLFLSELFRDKGVDVSFWGSCPVLLKEFKEKKFITKKAFFVKDITSLKSLLISPIYIISLYLQAFFVLLSYSLRGTKKIIMTSLIEQVFLTIPAKLLGYDVFWWHHLPPRKSILKNPFLPIWKLSSKHAVLLSPSNFVKNEFEKIGVRRLFVLPNAVFFFNEPISEILFSRVNSEKLKVGMGCRLSPEKGINEFLKLAKLFPQYDFYLAGEGPMREEIENYISKNRIDNINLLGFINPDEMKRYFSTLDIFCVFSEYESFGIAAAEASYLGIPVLASNVAALPEVIINNKTGLLFEYGNFNDLKDKFIRLTKNFDLRRELGENGHTFISSKYMTKNFFDKAWKVIFENKT